MLHNFRDISNYNKKIKANLIFRSSQYGLDSNIMVLKESNIDTIIDLRTETEINKFSYKELLLNEISYFNISLDLELAKTIYPGTPMESAYRYLSLNCNDEIAIILKIVLNAKGPILIHCRQGIDRTGIVIALLHLLCDSEKDILISDYMQSESNVVRKHLEIFISGVESYGSVYEYLLSCGMHSSEIDDLKNKLSK